MMRPTQFLPLVLGTVVTLTLTPVLRGADGRMHLRLTKSEPAAGSTVPSPKELRLWFSLKPQLVVTTVKLIGPGDHQAPLGKPLMASMAGAPIVVPVTGTLTQGTWRVQWKTASRDMHAMTGEYSFSVK